MYAYVKIELGTAPRNFCVHDQQPRTVRFFIKPLQIRIGYDGPRECRVQGEDTSTLRKQVLTLRDSKKLKRRGLEP